jgi:hypothetical protein
MQTLNLEEQRLLQGELSGGEAILWTGKPSPRVIFDRSDLAVIPFSLLWAGFAIFWEMGVSGHGFAPDKNPSIFMQLWGVPFVIIGQYFVWGRFFFTAWKKSSILYALTNQRLFVLVRPPNAKTISLYLRGVDRIQKEIRPDGIGTLKFGETPPIFGSRGQKTADMSGLYLNNEIPVFVDIDDAAAVADQVDKAMKLALPTSVRP